MKVILLQDVARIGKRFEIVEVPNGHALNQLIPQGKAEAATPVNVKRIEARAAKLTATQLGSETAFKEAVAKLQEAPLTVVAEANEQEHLFEGLKPAMIAASAAATGVSLAPENIILSQPIKTLGEHSVSLQYGAERADITINVIRK